MLGLSSAVVQAQTQQHPRGAAYQSTPGHVADDPHFNDLVLIPRRDAYLCDILYGINHEFGFDYLRDNMAFSADELVQRELNYAIADEANTILADDARTPLIMSVEPQPPVRLSYR